MTATEYVEGLRLRYFSAAEILYLGSAHERYGTNTEPPASLWRNIVRTAWLADQAREALGRPVWVLSGYRNEEYNRQIGGSRASMHLQFNALDLRSADPAGLYRVLRGFRDAGVFKGGLGRYATFVHVDTRGNNATW